MSARFTRKLTLTAYFFLIFSNAFTQCNYTIQSYLTNPSLEGSAPANGLSPAPWTACMYDGTSTETPDLQPGLWGVTLAPVDGISYVGLVADPISGWQEGIAQRLIIPLRAGTQYNFTAYLANSSATGGGLIPDSAECQVWGGSSACDTAELLWHSGNIMPFDTWRLYNINFRPAHDYTWILFKIKSLGNDTSEPYILIDNISTSVQTTLQTQFINVVNENCYADTTGSAVLQVTGPNAPFTYAWSRAVQTINDTIITGLAAGEYTVTVTDTSQCTAIADIVITQPDPITSDFYAHICRGNVYHFNDTTYAQTGYYINTYASASGCDSTVVLYLFVDNPGVTWQGGIPDSFMYTGASLQLTNGMPSGGAYIGPAVHGGIWYTDSLVNGTYTLAYIYIDSIGCSDTAYRHIQLITTAVTELNIPGFTFSIYPNPATGNDITLNATITTATNLQLNLYDATGRQLLTNTCFLNAGHSKVALQNNLSTGIYYLSIVDTTTGLTGTLRFLKQ